MTASEASKLLAWTIIGSQLAPPLMFSGVAVALPPMAADLGATATQVGLVETLFLAGGLGFLLPIAHLADAGDKRTLYKIGLLAFGLLSLAIGAVSAVPLILGIRLLQGVSSAILASTGVAVLMEIVPPAQRGRAIGSAIGAAYAGLTLGPIGAGLVSDHFGWRGVFLAGGALLLIAAFVVQLMMPSRWRRPAALPHGGSTATVILAVLSLVAGSATLHHGVLGYGLFAAGLLLATGFVALQRRLPAPLLDVRALGRNREVASALLIQLLLYMNAFTSVFLLSLFMQVGLGHSAKSSGQVIAVGSVLMALVAPIAGRLADRYPPRLISTVGVALVFSAVLLALRFDEASGLGDVALMLALQGVGFAFFSSPNMAIIMGGLPKEAGSMASALAAKSRSLGMVFGMLASAVLISLELGDAPVQARPEALIGILGSAYVILAATTAAALVVSMVGSVRR